MLELDNRKRKYSCFREKETKNLIFINFAFKPSGICVFFVLVSNLVPVIEIKMAPVGAVTTILNIHNIKTI